VVSRYRVSLKRYDILVHIFFKESFYKLKDKGLYIIEDIQAINIESFKNLSVFPDTFRSHILNTYDIKYFDTRYNNNRYREDDFMIAFIRK
jgi:hypothetical protein